MSEIIVTTCDVKQDYQVICPLYIQISNNGLLNKNYNKLAKEYLPSTDKSKPSKFGENTKILCQNDNVERSKFEQVFFIGVEELKKRAKNVGADAIIGLRQAFKVGENDFDYFYIELYGTAVKFI